MPPPRKAAPRPRSFNCPKCAGPVAVRYPERAKSVVCPRCRSILDTSTPQVRLMKEYAQKLTIKPQIPLGARGKLRGIDSEVVGFLRRGGTSEGYRFHWDEYLLYNPYTGYRFLAETSQGWQITSMTNEIPRHPSEYPIRVQLGGRTFWFSEAYTAYVQFVLGEFYWQVEIGEKVRCIDYKEGPNLLMAEVMADEYIWSSGSAIPAKEVWEAFRLPGLPRTYPQIREEESGSPSLGTWIAIIVVIIIIIIMKLLDVGGEGGRGGFFGGK